MSSERRPQGAGSSRASGRQVAIVVLIVLVLILAVLNTDEVQVNWILGTWSTPLIVLILVCLAVGAGIGWMLARRRQP